MVKVNLNGLTRSANSSILGFAANLFFFFFLKPSMNSTHKIQFNSLWIRWLWQFRIPFSISKSEVIYDCQQSINNMNFVTMFHLKKKTATLNLNFRVKTALTCTIATGIQHCFAALLSYIFEMKNVWCFFL